MTRFYNGVSCRRENKGRRSEHLSEAASIWNFKVKRYTEYSVVRCIIATFIIEGRIVPNSSIIGAQAS